MELGMGKVVDGQRIGDTEIGERAEPRVVIEHLRAADHDERQKSAQKIFDEYRNIYNNIRPHHSLDLDVPAKHYERSNREYNPDIKEWEYSKEAEIRKVKETGFFSFANQRYFLSEAFANKEIAVCNSPRKDCIDLYFRQFHIGRINTDKRCFEFKKAYLIKDDPREFLLQKV